jgi:uncharacterized membrane protein
VLACAARLAVLLRALALLAATASALTLFVIELRVKAPVALLSENHLSARNRNLAVLQMLAAAAAVAVLGGLLAWRARTTAPAKLAWLSHLAAPLLLLPFLPALLTEGYADLPTLVAAFALFLLVLERLLRLSAVAWDERPRMPTPRWLVRPALVARAALTRLSTPAAFMRRHLPLLLVLTGVVFYAFYMSRYTLYQHRKFGTMGYDLGQYDAMIYSTLRGLPMRCAPLGLEEPWSNLRGHADFGILLVLPFYALRPGSETILIFQASVLALGALPLFLFARRWLPQGWAAVIAGAYLCYPPLHGANFYDFHLQPVAAVLVLWAIYFLEVRRWAAYWAFFVLALICREDISIGLCVLGLFLVLSGYRPRAGALTAAIAGTYFVLMRFVIMPHFGSWWFSDMYKGLYPVDDSSFRGVVRTLISNPAYVLKSLLTADKLRYALQVLAPLVFLPIRRVWLVPSLFGGVASTVLTTGYAPTIDTGFQYIGHFLGYMFPAAAVALSSIGTEIGGRARRRAAGLTLVVATVLASINWGAFSPHATLHGGFGIVTKSPPADQDVKKEKDLRELVGRLPRQARLAASEGELPHVSTRLNIFSLRDGLFDADYVIYDVRGMGAGNGEAAQARGEYELVEQRDTLKLLRRATRSP